MAAPADLRYGPSGLPPGEPEQAVAALADAGYSACEVSFARRYPKGEELERLRAAAGQADIRLSVHGPLFAFPGNTDPAKRRQALSNVDHSAGLARRLGADVVVMHPGFLLGRTRERAIAETVAHLGEMHAKLVEKGREIPFGVEVMGRVRELGSLEDVVEICRGAGWVQPVVDFAHMQATSDGGFREPADFRAALDLAAGALGDGARLHVHFSDIRYANRNEDRHMRYGEGTLRAEPLREALEGFPHPVTVVSESPDEDSHQAIGRALGALR